MVDTVTRRIIELDVKTSGEALAALKAQQEALKRVEKQIQSAKDAVKDFAGGFAAAFSAGAVLNALKSVISEMDNAVDSAQALGLSVSELTAWNHAAEMSSASAEDFAAGVKGLSKNLANMDDETAKTTKQLKAFGVTATDTTDQALTKIAEGFSKIPDGAQKSALSMELLGKAGMKLIPMLNGGAEGIEELKKQAEDLGIVFSDQAAKAANEFGDSLDIIQKKSKGAMVQLATGLLPALNAVASQFTSTGEASDLFKSAGEALGEVIVWLSRGFIGVSAGIEAVIRGVVGLLFALDQLSQRDFKGAMETVKHVAQDVEDIIDGAGKKMAALDRQFQQNKEKMKAPVAPPTTPTGIPNIVGNTSKAKVDQDVQALERFIKTTREAALAVSQLTSAQQLDYQIASGQIKVSTEKEKKLLAEAKAAAGLLDLRKRQQAEEAADLALGKEQQAERDKQLERIKQLRQAFEDMADPTQAITRSMKELDEVMAETFDGEAVARLQKASIMLRQDFTAALMFGKNGAKDMKDALKSLGETLQQEIEGYSKNAADALVEFATTGKSSVKDMVTSILSDLAKLAVKKQLDPIFADFGKWIGSFATSAKGNVFGHSGVQAFASGGMVSSPTFFGMSGGGTGLMGEAGPEAVVPLKRTASGDLGVQASPVNVTVINNNGSSIKTEESRGSMGEQQIRILVDSAVEEGIGRGRFDRVMSTTYGVSRRGR